MFFPISLGKGSKMMGWTEKRHEFSAWFFLQKSAGRWNTSLTGRRASIRQRFLNSQPGDGAVASETRKMPIRYRALYILASDAADAARSVVRGFEAYPATCHQPLVDKVRFPRKKNILFTSPAHTAVAKDLWRRNTRVGAAQILST